MEEPSPLLQSPENDEAVRLTNYCNDRISSDCGVAGQDLAAVLAWAGTSELNE
jgi:hypothetical protein